MDKGIFVQNRLFFKKKKNMDKVGWKLRMKRERIIKVSVKMCVDQDDGFPLLLKIYNI